VVIGKKGSLGISSLDLEAKSFSDRISERAANGFVPDLQNLVDCDFFYKSFWRRPLYASLYFGAIVDRYIEEFSNYLGSGSTILDYGCGPGYCALELARNGFKVVGCDISEGAIAAATRRLEELRSDGEVLDIQYYCGDQGCLPKDLEVDGILFSGVLHHLPDCMSIVSALKKSLKPEGLVVAHEPQHEYFKYEDAKIVAMLRLFLANCGVWFESISIKDPKELEDYIESIHREYVLERDPDEKGGQSPNDLSQDGRTIKKILEAEFTIISANPTYSFVYRCMGGLRGDDVNTELLAKGMAAFDKGLVEAGVLNANYFMWVGKK